MFNAFNVPLIITLMHFRDRHIKKAEWVSLVITQQSRAYGTRVYDYNRKPTKALTALNVRQKTNYQTLEAQVASILAFSWRMRASLQRGTSLISRLLKIPSRSAVNIRPATVNFIQFNSKRIFKVSSKIQFWVIRN